MLLGASRYVGLYFLFSRALEVDASQHLFFGGPKFGELTLETEHNIRINFLFREHDDDNNNNIRTATFEQYASYMDFRTFLTISKVSGCCPFSRFQSTAERTQIAERIGRTSLVFAEFGYFLTRRPFLPLTSRRHWSDNSYNFAYELATHIVICGLLCNFM